MRRHNTAQRQTPDHQAVILQGPLCQPRIDKAIQVAEQSNAVEQVGTKMLDQSPNALHLKP